VFTVYSQSPLPAALLCLLADIPLRLAHCRENPYELLTDWIREREPEEIVRHEVRRQLDLVGALGLTVADEHIAIRLPAEAYERPRRLLRAAGIDLDASWVVVHPGASAPSRRYRADGYASVVRGLEESGHRVILTGDASELPLVEEVQAGAGVETVSLAGALEIAELAALLAMAPVLVANNSGPVHLAAAVGTPVVDLYALTNPQHTPWGVESRVLFKDVPCRSCYKSVCLREDHACLDLIDPGEVIEAALAIEGRSGRNPEV
jgi:ADP-heptose:LPS heptosyltransferase